MTAASTLALVILGFAAFGLVLLATLSLVPATSAGSRGLWPVMGSEIVIGAVTIAFVLPGGVVLALGVALLAARCSWEAATVVLGGGDDMRRPALALGAACAVAATLAWFGGGLGSALAVALAAAAIAATSAFGRGLDRRSALILLAFPTLPLIAFASVASRGDGPSVLFLAFLLVETMDSFAVLGGRLMGRHKVFPRLSPRKTVEGLASGAVALLAAAFVLGAGVMGWSTPRILAVAAVSAVATVAGDLVASAVKRRAGVKDYPPIHPVQGGVLDIVDAWIVTAPCLTLALAL